MSPGDTRRRTRATTPDKAKERETDAARLDSEGAGSIPFGSTFFFPEVARLR